MRLVIFLTVISVHVALAKLKKPKCYDVKDNDNWHLLDRGSRCGRSKELTDRVMGGGNAALAEFPWMARLYYRTKNQAPSHRCGGSIINERYILTAAHCCFGDMDSELLFVRLGDYDNGTAKDCYRGDCAPTHTDIQVESLNSHPSYNPIGHVNDICLVRLEDPIQFSEYIQPVCLPSPCELQSSTFKGETMVTAGWGYVDQVPRQLDVLQKLEVPVVQQSVCKETWEEVDSEVQIKPSQICAGKKVGRDVCGGDSGGPLSFKTEIDDGPARYFIIGLVSFGLPCSQTFEYILPGVYTRISYYLPWIINSIRG